MPINETDDLKTKWEYAGTENGRADLQFFVFQNGKDVKKVAKDNLEFAGQSLAAMGIIPELVEEAIANPDKRYGTGKTASARLHESLDDKARHHEEGPEGELVTVESEGGDRDYKDAFKHFDF